MAAVYSEAKDMSHNLRFLSYFNRGKGSKFHHHLLTHCIVVTSFKNVFCVIFKLIDAVKAKIF